MHTKLTLRLDDQLIRCAKSHARKEGKSVSRLVEDYFALLDQSVKFPGNKALPPVTRALYGALALAQIDDTNYYDYLKEKHQ